MTEEHAENRRRWKWMACCGDPLIGTTEKGIQSFESIHLSGTISTIVLFSVWALSKSQNNTQ